MVKFCHESLHNPMQDLDTEKCKTTQVSCVQNLRQMYGQGHVCSEPCQSILTQSQMRWAGGHYTPIGPNLPSHTHDNRQTQSQVQHWMQAVLVSAVLVGSCWRCGFLLSVKLMPKAVFMFVGGANYSGLSLSLSPSPSHTHTNTHTHIQTPSL